MERESSEKDARVEGQAQITAVTVSYITYRREKRTGCVLSREVM